MNPSRSREGELPEETLEEEADEAGARVSELEGEVAELRARLLRTAADFDNYKKRSRQELQEGALYAAQDVVVRLLPVLDDLERGLAHAPRGIEEGWLKGLTLSVQNLESVLGDLGLKRIEAVGQAFDPALHEAIGTEESGEHPEDTVLDELRGGYRLHDRVVRPALVRVSRRPA